MEEDKETKAAAEQTPDFGETFDVVIIGAGVGGLTCGALLAKAGAKVMIAERHDRPGGFVTDFERKGYRFQVPRIMGGCGPGGDLAKLLDHLGARVDFTQVDPYLRFVYPEHDISLSSETGEFAETLKESFQPQTDNINRFFKTAESVQKGLDMTLLRSPRGLGAALRLMVQPFLHLGTLGITSGRATCEKVLDSHFADEQLRSVMAAFWLLLGSPPWELSALPVFTLLKSFAWGAHFPAGGYGALSEELARVFTESGGTLLTGHDVTSVNSDEGRVSEVELMPRSKVSTGVVVSDADSRRTFLTLCRHEDFPRSFLERQEEGVLSTTGFTIHLGMAKEIDEAGLAGGPVLFFPSYDHREMFEELSAADRFPDPEKLPFGLMVPSAHDPGLAPKGCSCLEIFVPGVPYGFRGRWGVEGGVRGDKYVKTKEKYAEVVVEAVSRRFGDLIGSVEAYEISTPVTYERYTMAADGCWYDAAQVPGQVLGRRPGPRTPLKGLYVTGSKSVLGGGICSSMFSGLLAADSVLGGGLRELF